MYPDARWMAATSATVRNQKKRGDEEYRTTECTNPPEQPSVAAAARAPSMTSMDDGQGTKRSPLVNSPSKPT